MSQKEDILELVVEAALRKRGYFTQANVKYRPSPEHPDFQVRQDSNHSDIDVLAYHPTKRGADRVLAVSCKSWQSGFDVQKILKALANNKKLAGKEAWKLCRELVKPKWSEAFVGAVREATGTKRFTHATAVTRVVGDPTRWTNNAAFIEAVGGNPLSFLTFSELADDLDAETGTTLAESDVGRLLQVMRASGWKAPT